MPYVYLDATEKSHSYGQKVSVKRYEYNFCNLIYKYEHKVKGKTEPGNIWVYKNYCSSLSCSYMTLELKGSYNRASFLRAEVYFNKYENKTPLILVFHFSGGQSRYYKYSVANYYITNNSFKNVSYLNPYKKEKGDEQLLEELIDENDKLFSLLIYQIDKKASNATDYNNNKVRLVEKKNEPPKLTNTEFTKYKHTPNGPGRGRKGCLVYNNNQLLERNDSILSGVQDISYGHVNVYYSSNVTTPLLIELNFLRKRQENNEFYCINMNNGLFWEKLDSKNFQRFTGHKISDSDSIYTQLTAYNNNNLFKLLETLASKLFKTIYFFVDRQKGSYGNEDIQKSLGNYIYNLHETNGKIKITDQTVLDGKTCLNKTEFRVFEHNFTENVTGISDSENIKLKFIKFNSANFTSNHKIIDLDKKKFTQYMYGSREIIVASGFNMANSYTWYRHSSLQGKITQGLFDLKVNGETVKINGDLTDHQSNNNQLVVYFKTGKTETFVLIAFPSKDLNMIRYINYSDFQRKLKSDFEIKLSERPLITAKVKHYDEESGIGQQIDPGLLKVLNEEYEKNYTMRIEVNQKPSQNYKTGSIDITVIEREGVPSNGYKCHEHKFNKSTNPLNIVFHQNHYTKILDIAGKFTNDIASVNFYYNSSDITTPLIIGLINETDKKYLKYAEFFFNVNNPVNLSDLNIILEHLLDTELKKQYKYISSNLALDIFSTDIFSGFNISPPNPFGNFKYYIHTPNRYFNSINLEERSIYKIKDFRGSDYTYKNLSNINIYFHGFDKDNQYPLIIEIYTKFLTRENDIDYNSSYYCLSDIDKYFIKSYKSIVLSYKTLNSGLNETYEKFKEKIDKDLEINVSNLTHSLDYSRGNNNLYVYFYGNDPRPLLICYGNKAYKRQFIGEQTSKWIEIKGVSNCLCNVDKLDDNISVGLNELVQNLCLIKPKSSLVKGQEIDIEIDTSITNSKYNNLNSITVSALEEYQNCNLFKYCTHSLTTSSTFKISSVKISKPVPRTITIDESISNVLSVKVYFNIHVQDTPVMLEFILIGGMKKYLEYFDQEDTTYQSSSLIELQEHELVGELISKSDRINNRNTFQIDSTDEYNGIKVETNPASNKNYTEYTHSPERSLTKQSNIIYKNKLLDVHQIDRAPEIDVQDKKYECIKVYVLDVDKSMELFLELKSSESNIYLYRLNSNGTFKKIESFDSSNQTNVKNKLDEIYYLLKNSLLVELDKKSHLSGGNTYVMKQIENLANPGGRTPNKDLYNYATNISPVQNIEVSDVTRTIQSLSDSSFHCYSHDISQSKEFSKRNIIGGIRLYLSKTGTFNNDLIEAQLYKNNKFNNNENRMFIYYTPSQNIDQSKSKIYTYFYLQDPRPLLIYYHGQAFKRSENDNSKWIHVKEITNFDTDPHILSNLNDIYRKIKKKLIFLKDGEKDQNITKTQNKNFGQFIKDSYSAKGSSKSQEVNLSKNVIISQVSTTHSNINQILDGLNNNSFDSINVYKRKTTFSIVDILLFEFINETQKTYYSRKDSEGYYWDKDSFSSNINDEPLLKISSESSNTVVYEISKNTTSNSSIKIKPNSDNLETGFTKYIHSPNDGNAKTSIVCYYAEKLKEKYNSQYQPISQLQNQKYSSITAYFGEKIKGSGAVNQKNVPLLIELTKEEGSTKPDYYVHRLNPTDKKYYWQKLTGTYLKDILIDIGFATNKGNPGYEQLNKLLSGSGVDKISEANDLSTKLAEIKPDQLKKLLDQRVGLQPGPSPKTLLTLLIRKIEFDLLSSIVILLDKKDRDKHYGEIEVSGAISNLEPKREINLVSMSGGGKKINLSNQTTKKPQCIDKYSYKLMVHELKNVTEGIGDPSQSSIPIRFIVPTLKNNYNHLTLYNNEKTGPENLEYTYYTPKHNEIYVYYYGEDPRPLLICYQETLYKPIKLDYNGTNNQVRVEYSRWVKVNSVKQHTCGLSGRDGGHDKLLDVLTEVSGYLNTVQLNPHKLPHDASVVIIKGAATSKTYDLHNYSTDITIKIKITSHNMNCYRKYTYEPNISNSFRLGNIIHTNTSSSTKINNLLYNQNTNTKHHPLISVTSFYHTYDDNHNFPLLVMLEFKNIRDKQLYKLEKNSNTWVRLDPSQEKDLLDKLKESDTIKFEEGLYQLRQNQKITFTNDDYKKYIFDPKNCSEDNSNLGLYVGAPVGTLTGAGAIGGGGYLVYTYVFAASAPV